MTTTQENERRAEKIIRLKTEIKTHKFQKPTKY